MQLGVLPHDAEHKRRHVFHVEGLGGLDRGKNDDMRAAQAPPKDGDDRGRPARKHERGYLQVDAQRHAGRPALLADLPALR